MDGGRQLAPIGRSPSSAAAVVLELGLFVNLGRARALLASHLLRRFLALAGTHFTKPLGRIAMAIGSSLVHSGFDRVRLLHAATIARSAL